MSTFDFIIILFLGLGSQSDEITSKCTLINFENKMKLVISSDNKDGIIVASGDSRTGLPS